MRSLVCCGRYSTSSLFKDEEKEIRLFVTAARIILLRRFAGEEKKGFKEISPWEIQIG